MSGPTFDDLVAVGMAAAQAKRPDLSFNEGDVTEAQIHAGAVMADAVVRQINQAVRATFLDGATGEKLDTLIEDHFGGRDPTNPSNPALLHRKDAVAAEAPVAFLRVSGGAGGSIPAGTEVATVHTPDGQRVTFATIDPVVVGAGANGPFAATVRCTVAGRVGNVRAGEIAVVLSPLFDTFTVTNASPASGGSDVESDEDLRARARTFYRTLHRGTKAAIEFGARLVPGVASAHAVVEDELPGIITVQIADSDGNATLEMISNVQAELENWRVAGVTVKVVGGGRRVVDMTIAVLAREGFDVEAAATLLADAVKNRIAKLREGETLYLDSVIGALARPAADDILDVTFTSIAVDGTPRPIADIPAALGDRLVAGVITITVPS